MALHVGIVQQRDGDYFGPLLNRVARLCTAGHGGQILVSNGMQELVRDSLPRGTELRELGEHRLEDLIRPERIFQAVAPDLPADFPPLRTLDRRFTLLTGGPRDLPAHQQTLRNAISWSYDLLDPAEQAIFAHLGCLLVAARLRPPKRCLRTIRLTVTI
jgi:hypothetical protein